MLADRCGAVGGRAGWSDSGRVPDRCTVHCPVPNAQASVCCLDLRREEVVEVVLFVTLVTAGM